MRGRDSAATSVQMAASLEKSCNQGLQVPRQQRRGKSRSSSRQAAVWERMYLEAGDLGTSPDSEQSMTRRLCASVS